MTKHEEEHRSMIVAQMQGAVLAIFMERGAYATVADIARKLGVSPGTVLRRIDKISSYRTIPGCGQRSLRRGGLWGMGRASYSYCPDPHFLRQEILTLQDKLDERDRAREDEKMPY